MSGSESIPYCGYSNWKISISDGGQSEVHDGMKQDEVGQPFFHGNFSGKI